jgi:hypothetical protein
MRWVIAAVLAVLVVVLVGTQLALPPIIGSKIADRLTEQGGTAKASVHAMPALRLLFRDGDRLTVDAYGVEIPVNSLAGGSMSKLDGFDDVSITLSKSRVGPFSADEMHLDRPEGESLYDFSFRGATSASELSSFAFGALPAGLGALIGSLVNRATQLGGSSIPVRLDADLRSENGTARLVRGSGSVAGLPLGPLAVGIAGAVVSRLTS